MHQPVTPLIDPISTSSDVEGGTLTSDISGKFLSSQISSSMSPDQMIDMPFYGCQFDMNSSDGYNTLKLNYDPFVKVWNDLSSPVVGERPVPYPLVALSSCYFYDFDMELTFMAIKHERARGIYDIIWAPGLIDTSVGDFNIATTKFQKWVWDVEASDTFRITLNSVKTAVWRERRLRYVSQAPPVFYAPWVVEPLVAQTLASCGTLQVRSDASYNAGSVGPDTATVLVLHRLVNLRTAEYRPPYSVTVSEVPLSYAANTPT